MGKWTDLDYEEQLWADEMNGHSRFSVEEIDFMGRVNDILIYAKNHQIGKQNKSGE